MCEVIVNIMAFITLAMLYTIFCIIVVSMFREPWGKLAPKEKEARIVLIALTIMAPVVMIPLILICALAGLCVAFVKNELNNPNADQERRAL